MTVLIIVEHHASKVKPALLHVLSAATQLSSDIDLLVVGHGCTDVVEEIRHYAKVRRIRVADHLNYEHQLAENTASLIAEIATAYDYVLAAASTYSKNILPRVAALLNLGMLSDVVKIISEDTVVRPIYAGNVLATVKTLDKIKIMTIRATAFPRIALDQTGNPIIEPIAIIKTNTLSHFESHTLTQSKRPELTVARIIVSGGRGLKSADHFQQLLEPLADQLGAAIGASRAAVDAGFAPNDYQVGQTGKIVAPDLYIAIGISGAIQHLAGMKESKVVVAINNDPEAPIFQVADYCLVGDLFSILPELREALSDN
jgi:electron transfer flavoprotein alpha subunit